MEIEKRGDRGGLGEVTLALGLRNAIEGAVEAVDVGLMMFRVVELHDLGGNIRLESAIIVLIGRQGQQSYPDALARWTQWHVGYQTIAPPRKD